jgi:hypothetical protein
MRKYLFTQNVDNQKNRLNVILYLAVMIKASEI